MAKKFYAVRVGKDGPGIYETWEACKKQVFGVNRAVYKSFPTREEAQAFLLGGETQNQKQLDESWAVAYVDGSYQAATRRFSCGVVILYAGKEEHLLACYDDPELAQMHNVAGEIKGSQKAIMSFWLF